MSNADSEEVSVVVERGGITVEKSFEPEDFPVPAIAFVIRSERDEPTDVRLVDTVPDDVPAQDIGFHPKYGADFWSVEDEEIVFEREFEAGEEYTTVYGLRAKDTDDIERFLSEPTIEGVEGEETVSDIIGEEEPEEADEGEAGDDEEAPSIDLNDPDEAVPGDEPEAVEPTPAEASADDLESAIADVEDPEADQAAEDEAEPEAEPGDDGDIDVDVGTEPAGAAASGAAVDVEDLASALADEIRAGEVDDDDLDTLRDALGADLDGESVAVEAEVPGHVEAKLDSLQADVSEVTAYTAALEEFLDEAGTADDLLAVREEVDELRETVDGMEDRVESVADTAESAASDADTAVDRAAEVEEQVDTLRADLDDHVSSLEDDLSELRADVEAMEADLAEDLEGRVTDLEDELDAMEDDIETLENLRQALAGGD